MATNKFFDYIQPTIVKTSDHPRLPEHLRNRYLINYNVFGIRYFEKYYLLTESKDGFPYLIMNEEDWGIELEKSPDGFDKILDLPRLYIDITDKFIAGEEMFRSFIYQAIMQNSIYGSGTDTFVPGVDYWLNSTLFNYLANTNQIDGKNSLDRRLPNYLTEIPSISEYFEDISDSPFKDYTNLDYYEKKNGLRDNEYSEDELRDFYKNFCSLILEYTIINDDTRSSGNNPIYDIVINYYANYQSDNTSNSLALVLNSLYSTSTNSSQCTCNSSLNTFNSQSSVTDTRTCYQLYEDAMKLYLKQMLGDKQFYIDWFTIQLSEWDSEINDVMCEKIITFVEEFIGIEFCLDFEETHAIHNSLTCNTSTVYSTKSNMDIVKKYLNVLNFVKNNQIIENTNKIKIWGENFGELLPSLQF